MGAFPPRISHSTKSKTLKSAEATFGESCVEPLPLLPLGGLTHFSPFGPASVLVLPTFWSFQHFGSAAVLNWPTSGVRSFGGYFPYAPMTNASISRFPIYSRMLPGIHYRRFFAVEVTRSRACAVRYTSRDQELGQIPRFLNWHVCCICYDSFHLVHQQLDAARIPSVD